MTTATIAAAPRGRWREASILPGFGPTLGFVLLYLSLMLLIPLAALVARPWASGWDGVWGTVTQPRVLAALRLSFGAAVAAAAINTVMGLLVAWVLTRYDFPGRRLADAMVDLPFALPTAVAGIALATVYGPHGWIGGPLAPLGVKIAYTRLGILVALVAVGLPFIVRSVQPVLQDFDAEVEEAAVTLGARAWRRAVSVVLPAVAPALVTGFALAFARAVGEYGSVIFIAGNMPGRSEIAPLLIVIKLNEFDDAGAASVGLAMLVLSFGALLAVNLVQLAMARRGHR
ncbi:MAG TPA: sulfate ABC transporter permease subunit CysT [Caulobacteraceae bacterium]|nr:sulfate ABC transporter permease subunit CysT [Caulobacteraceae bacterium]